MPSNTKPRPTTRIVGPSMRNPPVATRCAPRIGLADLLRLLDEIADDDLPWRGLNPDALSILRDRLSRAYVTVSARYSRS